MLVNAANLRTLGIGFSAAFQGGLTSGVMPTWSKIAMKVPSTTGVNEYGWLGKLSRMREWLGDRVINSLSVDGYRIRNRKFENTVGVSRTDVERDNIGIYSPVFEELGASARTFPDELVWPLLQAGMVTPCYDGQYFFDIDHPVLDRSGATYSVANLIPGGGPTWYLFDMTRAVKPIIYQEEKPFRMVSMDAPTDEVVFSRDEFRYGVDGRCNAGYGLWQYAFASQQPLTVDNYAAARTTMQAQLGDYGRPLGVRAGLLVVPPTLEAAARKVLNAEIVAYAGGVAAETNVWRNSAELHVEPWLNA